MIEVSKKSWASEDWLSRSEARRMEEKRSDCRDEAQSAAVDVEELLRVLEAAVENELVLMKGNNGGVSPGSSNFLHLQRNDETTDSSSAGTPNSVYSAAESSFSRSSSTKDKSSPFLESSQHDGNVCTSDEPKQTDSSECPKEQMMKQNLGYTLWEERVEAALKSLHNLRLHDSDSPGESGDNTSESDKILGNFQNMLQRIMASNSDGISSHPCRNSSSPKALEESPSANTSVAAIKIVDGALENVPNGSDYLAGAIPLSPQRTSYSPSRSNFPILHADEGRHDFSEPNEAPSSNMQEHRWNDAKLRVTTELTRPTHQITERSLSLCGFQSNFEKNGVMSRNSKELRQLIDQARDSTSRARERPPDIQPNGWNATKLASVQNQDRTEAQARDEKESASEGNWTCRETYREQKISMDDQARMIHQEGGGSDRGCEYLPDELIGMGFSVKKLASFKEKMKMESRRAYETSSLSGESTRTDRMYSNIQVQCQSTAPPIGLGNADKYHWVPGEESSGGLNFLHSKEPGRTSDQSRGRLTEAIEGGLQSKWRIEEPVQPSDSAITSHSTACGSHYMKTPAHCNEVEEHAVGFGCTCCTPDRGAQSFRVPIRSRLHKLAQVSQFFSNQTDEHVKESLEVLRSTNGCAPSQLMEERIGHVESEHLSEWARKELGRTYEAFHEATRTAPKGTRSKELWDFGGGNKIRRMCDISSESLRWPKTGGWGGFTESSNSGTPKSVLTKACNLSMIDHHREKVKVCVRMRPFDDHEKVCPLKQILCVLGDKVIVREHDQELTKPSCRRSKDFRETGSLEFKVDNVVDDSYLQKHRMDKKEESQRRMYELIGLPCLEYALDGYNTTIIAYGQVGSGKTYTMMGDDTDEGTGLMPRLAKDLMHQLDKELGTEFAIQVSYLEIYQERIRDLLAKQKVEPPNSRCGSAQQPERGASRCGSARSDHTWLDSSDDGVYEESIDNDTASYSSFGVGTARSWRDHRVPSVSFEGPTHKKEYLKVREHPVTGPYVEGLLWKDASTWEDMEQVMLEGASRRTLGANNRNSSRGHCLFTFKISKGPRGFIPGRNCHVSFINLVDLAGSEKTQCARNKAMERERQDESRHNNRSIAQLNDVILNLSRNNKFVSYRSSALTWLLRESLGGNAKTFLIATLSPAEQDFQEGINTLRYAARANRIHSLITSQRTLKKELFVNMKKEIQLLHELVQDLTKSKAAEELIKQRVTQPSLSSFTVPRIQIPPDHAIH